MSKRIFEDYVENECLPTGYNEPCQSYIFGQGTVDMLLDKIADLEAKLADSESIRKGANEEIKKLHKRINEIVERDKNIVEKLKQQLTEKEDRINRLQFEVQQALSNSLGKTIKELIDKDNQDKISFCIEQLEKVKENIKKVPITDYDLNGRFEKIYKIDAIRQVDKLINELKEKK